MSDMMCLAQLSSLFEVSIGIHLLYTVFPDLRGFFVRRVEERQRWAAEYVNRLLNEDTNALSSQGIAWSNLEMAEIVLRRQLLHIDHIFSKYVAVAVAAAAFSTICIIIISFFPNLGLPRYLMLAVAAVAILPMPCLVFRSYLKLRKIHEPSEVWEEIAKDSAKSSKDVAEGFEAMREVFRYVDADTKRIVFDLEEQVRIARTKRFHKGET